MPDLSPEQVQRLAGALGLDISEEDLPEVAHRINALQESLGGLEHPEVDAVEPLPVFWLQEGG